MNNMMESKKQNAVNKSVKNSSDDHTTEEHLINLIQAYFPYRNDKGDISFRPYQKETIKFILKNRKSIIHAPTGFGKTIVSLSAYLPFVEAGYQLLCFTRTKSQIFEVLIPELNFILEEHHKHVTHQRYLSIVPIIGKVSACIHPRYLKNTFDNKCNRGCPAYKAYQEFKSTVNIRLFLEQQFTTLPSSLQVLKAELEEYGCPYYILRLVAAFSDILITTHTFLTYPKLRSSFFNRFVAGFSNKLVIVDEIHNFGNQIINSISKEQIITSSKVIPHPIWQTLLEKFDRPYNQIKPIRHVTKLQELIQKKLSDNQITHKEKQAVRRCVDFLTDQGEIWFVTQSSVLMINPLPERIFEFLSKFDRVIGMSGSLFPISLYRRFLGLDKNQFRIFDIPISKTRLNQARYAIVDDQRFTSKYTKRSQRLYRYMSQAVVALHEINVYHTLVVVPSYQFLAKLEESVSQLLALQEKPKMFVEPHGRKSSPNWLTELTYYDHALILSVSKGKLTEGLEILDETTKQSKITAVVIAGLPYAPTSNFSLLLKRIYTQRWGHQIANELLLKLPMIQAVQQSSGRGIRSEKDFCATIILDHRAVYERLFPNPVIYRDFDHLLKKLQIFYQKNMQDRTKQPTMEGVT